MEKKDFKSPLWKKLEVASRGWATDCGWSVNPQKLYDFISQELDRAREEENKRCIDIINRIIQTSGEGSSNQWFDGLRSARESIKLTTK